MGHAILDLADRARRDTCPAIRAVNPPTMKPKIRLSLVPKIMRPETFRVPLIFHQRFLRSKLIPLATIACLGLWAGAPPKADAALYADGTTSAQTLAFGAPFAGRALSLRVCSPLFGGGQRSSSATFLNYRYALTSAHALTDVIGSITSIEVADGINYLTGRGNVMTVSRYILHPTLDIAILEFAASFPAAQNSTIGSAATHDTTISAGFGSWGTPSTGTTRDGGLRAWDARVADLVFSGSAPYYQSALFGDDNAGLLLNARGANGDSGGPVFNAQGELIGVNDFASTSIAPSGSTTYVRLGEPSTRAWIEANTALPAPDLHLSPAGSAMHLTWDAAAIGYRLQTSGELSTWADLSGSLTGPGSYDDPIANRPRQFYRLIKP